MKNIVKKFNEIKGVEVKDATDSSICISILNDNDFLKWDYFLERLENTSARIEIEKNYPDVRISFSETNIEKSKEMINLCLTKRFYYIEKPAKENITIITKVTNLCNMDCQYCYDRPFREKIGHNKSLTMEDMDKLLKLASEYAEAVTIVFHGGEPTLVGLDFYKKFFAEVCPKYPYCDFKFEMQTNGTLLDDEWIEFFHENGVALGTSYSAKSEDLRETREDNESTISTEDIFSVIPMALRAKEMGHPIGIIDVTTKFNHPLMIERYDFYKKKGLDCAFNHVDKTGEAVNHEFTFESGQDNRDYLNNTFKYFRYWLTDKTAINDRYAGMYLELLLTGECETCNFGGECIGKWSGINSNGDFLPCDRPLPSSYSMGNIRTINSFVDIYNSDNYRQYIQDRNHKKEIYCSNCLVYDYCKGGCPMEDIDFYGKADRPNRYSCKMMKFNLTSMFRALASVTIDEVSPLVRNYLIKNLRFLPGELSNVLELLNISNLFPGLDYNYSKVKLNSNEFKLFRVFNSPREEEWLNETHYSIFDISNDEECEDNRIEILIEKLKKLNNDLCEEL